jgi:protein ImuA
VRYPKTAFGGFMAAVASNFTFPAASFPESTWSAEAAQAGRSHPQPSAYRALDLELPNGGWPASVLIELLLAQPDIGELRLLAPTLTRLTQEGKTVILLAPAHISAALSDLGLDKNHLILIEADKPMDRIWAVEQAVKNVHFGALLCWLPEARPDHLRRLQLMAAANDGLTFVFRPLEAQNQSSPAPLRMLCQPAADGRMSVEIIKRRGPVHCKPIVLPLAVPAIIHRPRVARSLSSPVFEMSSYTIAHSALAATAARHRAALPV